MLQYEMEDVFRRSADSELYNTSFSSLIIIINTFLLITSGP